MRKIVDLGSNVGYSIVYFSRAYPHAVIEAYEPHPAHVQQAARHVAINALQDRVAIHAVAAGNQDCRMYLLEAENQSTLVSRSGPGRIDLAVSAAAREPCVAKIGARAVYAVALPDRGLSIAIKCASADEDAMAAALPPLLDRLAPGAFAWPDPWPWSVVRSKAGLPVGARTLE